MFACGSVRNTCPAARNMPKSEPLGGIRSNTRVASTVHAPAISAEIAISPHRRRIAPPSLHCVHEMAVPHPATDPTISRTPLEAQTILVVALTAPRHDSTLRAGGGARRREYNRRVMSRGRCPLAARWRSGPPCDIIVLAHDVHIQHSSRLPLTSRRGCTIIGVDVA